MTDKLTTAEVKLAATTNEDLPLTQYKKLEAGFDAWLESVKAEARAEGANGSEKPAKQKQPKPLKPIDPETGRPKLSRRDRARIRRREENKAKDLA